MLTAKRIQSIVEKAAAKLRTEPLPLLPAADVGAVPEALNGCSDTCAAYESDDVHQTNSCEGSDCISYDFPFGFVGKGVKR
jgi:hypothetical protein